MEQQILRYIGYKYIPLFGAILLATTCSFMSCCVIYNAVTNTYVCAVIMVQPREGLTIQSRETKTFCKINCKVLKLSCSLMCSFPFCLTFQTYVLQSFETWLWIILPPTLVTDLRLNTSITGKVYAHLCPLPRAVSEQDLQVVQHLSVVFYPPSQTKSNHSRDDHSCIILALSSTDSATSIFQIELFRHIKKHSFLNCAFLFITLFSYTFNNWIKWVSAHNLIFGCTCPILCRSNLSHELFQCKSIS